MEPAFVSEFEVTLKRYQEWAAHPVGKKAVRSRVRMKILCGVLGGCGILLLILGWGSGDLLTGVLFLTMALLEPLALRPLTVKRQYRLLREARMQERWVRTTTFSDHIAVKEGNTQTDIAYASLRQVTEDAGYFYLWQNENFVLRIPRDSFMAGRPEDFRAFLEKAMSAPVSA